jgi:hypothetical protein
VKVIGMKIIITSARGKRDRTHQESFGRPLAEKIGSILAGGWEARMEILLISEVNFRSACVGKGGMIRGKKIEVNRRDRPTAGRAERNRASASHQGS